MDYASRFRKEKLVGAGTYGKVYRALDMSEDPPRMVALKEIRLDTEDQGIPSTALREISLLRELDHPNVIKCAFLPTFQVPSHEALLRSRSKISPLATDCTTSFTLGRKREQKRSASRLYSSMLNRI